MDSNIIIRRIEIPKSERIISDGPRPPADISWIKNRHLDLVYADESNSQKLDLYIPEHPEIPMPLIIHIHGGAFMMCDKRDNQVEPWLQALNRGYAVASINYRMSGEKIFPAAVQDCKCAVRWLRAHAREFKLDVNKFAAVGESAGGHLGSMLAVSAGVAELEDLSQGNPDCSSAIQACIDWFGPTDFLKMDEQLEELGLGPLDHNNADSPESLYMGGRITELDYDWIQKSNPITYICDNLPPILIQHGNKDHLVCVSQSRIFYEAIIEKLGNGRVFFEILEGADHADIHFETEENMARNFAFLNEFLQLSD